jgi:hypothetical protein
VVLILINASPPILLFAVAGFADRGGAMWPILCKVRTGLAMGYKNSIFVALQKHFSPTRQLWIISSRTYI